MISVQKEKEIEGFADNRIRRELAVGLGEHQVQDLVCVGKVVAGISKRQTIPHAVGHGGDTANFGDENRCGVVKIL